MLHKFAKICFLIFIFLGGCKNFGFYQPMTLDLQMPDGPPEFRAGWRSGCRSALATKTFSNSFVYGNDYGNGIYQHDPAYAKGWGRGWFGCILHTANFVNAPSMRYFPLD